MVSIETRHLVAELIRDLNGHLKRIAPGLSHDARVARLVRAVEVALDGCAGDSIAIAVIAGAVLAQQGSDD